MDDLSQNPGAKHIPNNAMIPAIADARRIGQKENCDDLKGRINRLGKGDVITAHVRRFDPGVDKAARYETYRVPYEKWMRVLDVLIYISDELQTDLAFRWYCGSKMCGTCAMRVNGREVLACWEAAEPEMTIDPLRNLPVIRDLVVDRTPYEEKVRSLMPWLVRKTAYPGFPESFTHKQMKLASRALDCISCTACFSACPVVGLGKVTNFAGPAPLVQFAQAALDPRDGLDRGRIAHEEASVFSCVSCYKCEEVCPAGIPIVTGVIEPLKAIAYKSMSAHSGHAAAFMRVIKKRGYIDPSELVLGTQGISALQNIRRVVMLFLRGKIDPLRTFFHRRHPAGTIVRRLAAAAERTKR